MHNANIKKMVGISIMTAIVVVLQLLGSFIRVGPVSISLVLIPIVVGAAAYGPGAGAFLGGVFSIVVLLQPDTVFFHNITVVGTVLTVVVKGTLCGLLAGLTYRGLAKHNQWLAVILAAAVCPLVNTGIFVVCMYFFFIDVLAAWAGGGDAGRAVRSFVGFARQARGEGF